MGLLNYTAGNLEFLYRLPQIHCLQHETHHLQHVIVRHKSFCSPKLRFTVVLFSIHNDHERTLA
jgi:hypothetical protein